MYVVTYLISIKFVVVVVVVDLVVVFRLLVRMLYYGATGGS